MKKSIRILILCLITTFGYAQKKLSKTSQSIKVNKNVVVDLNTSYVEIEIDTWNKDAVEVEAYIESTKLSSEELAKALKSWNLKVDGSSDKVTISSTGGRSVGFFEEGDYTAVLKDLEFELADLPNLPELPEFPDMPMMPKMSKFPALPTMPDLPKMPDLPELPEGVNSVKFDYEKYQKDGETYLKEWSREYEKKGGKKLQKSMEEWARKFGESGYQEKMEKWGEEYGRRFDGKWAKDIEKWSEKFGKKYGEDMEKWGEELGEKFGKEWAEKMEVWAQHLGEKMEEKSKSMERRAAVIEKRSEIMAERGDAMRELAEQRAKRHKELAERRESLLSKHLESGSNSKVKKVIKIKIPKKAKLKMNVRHGELKVVSALHNVKGNVSHSFLVAENIDGGDTSINVSYSPVVINTWNLGTLNLSFVDKAQIKTAKNLVLNSKSSNINIENLTNTGIIDGSFGDLTISNLTESFKNLNLVLENSDALVNLPKDIDFTMYFKGNRSKYNNKVTEQKTIRNYPDGESSNRNIIVNAKYSNLIMN